MQILTLDFYCDFLIFFPQYIVTWGHTSVPVR